MFDLANLLCTLFGVALTVLFGVAIVRRTVRPTSTAAAYREVARILGLRMNTRGTSLAGHKEGRRIWMGEVLQWEGPRKRHELRGVVDLRRPLGLGLILRSRSRPRAVFHRYRAAPASLGVTDLDREFDARAVRVDRLTALLTPEVIEALRHLQDHSSDIMITDLWVQVSPRRAATRPKTVLDLLDAMEALANALESARTHVPVPQELAPLLPSWRELADQYELDLLDWLPALEGQLDGHPVLAACIRDRSRYRVDLRLHFARHREYGLKLEPQIGRDTSFASVGQDIQVDDDAFDDRFVVKGWDAALIRELLTSDVRASLLDLSMHGGVHIDDDVLELRNLPLESAQLAAALDTTRRVVRQLGW